MVCVSAWEKIEDNVWECKRAIGTLRIEKETDSGRYVLSFRATMTRDFRRQRGSWTTLSGAKRKAARYV